VRNGPVATFNRVCSHDSSILPMARVVALDEGVDPVVGRSSRNLQLWVCFGGVELIIMFSVSILPQPENSKRVAV
jgi:hypothetical protein